LRSINSRTYVLRVFLYNSKSLLEETLDSTYERMI
jgi:hypothetical protein